jgi:hypothetical protein
VISMIRQFPSHELPPTSSSASSMAWAVAARAVCGASCGASASSSSISRLGADVSAHTSSTWRSRGYKGSR